MPRITYDKPRKITNEYYPISIIKTLGSPYDKTHHDKLLYIDINKSGTHSIEIHDGIAFQPIPSVHEEKRDIYYIAGASGSGKSYIARTIANNYKKMFPEREIYLISKLDYDETLDKMDVPPKRIDYTTLKDNPLDINELSNSLIIFDDYDTITPKKDLDAVLNLINDIAIMGRKHHEEQGNISMLCLTHYLTNYKSTRLILNEANFFIIYPQATSYHALYYLLNTHVGMTKEDIKKMKKLNSRWVLIHKNFPQYMLSQHNCKILNIDESDEDSEYSDERIIRRRRRKKRYFK